MKQTKRWLSYFITMTILLFCSGKVLAQMASINGITYVVHGDAAQVASVNSNVTKAEILPTVTINGEDYPVRSIKYLAFNNCNDLTSITIPESITYIEPSAFMSLTGRLNITEIHIGSIESWLSIKFGSHLPTSEQSVDYYVDGELLTEIEIPSSITSIPDCAFYGSKSLSSVKIPEGVTKIGDYAFTGCHSLTSIIIPKSVTEIGCNALVNTKWYDNHLDGVIYAGNVLHKYKGEMQESTSIVVNVGTVSISPSAFAGCWNLTDITFHKSIKKIGLDAFANTTWYESQPEGAIYAGDVLYKYKGAGVAGVLVDEGIASISPYAFADCHNITSIFLPKSVTEIEDGTFSGCSNLAYITFLGEVNKIGAYAFKDCSSLTSITIPKSVTEIGQGAFSGCTGELIVNCNIPDFNPHYNPHNIYGGSGLFWGSNFSKLTIGEGVTRIGSEAFKELASLTSVTIPKSVTTIGGGAFFGCEGLTSVHISDIKAWCNIVFGTTGYITTPLSYAGNLYLNGELVTDLIIPEGVTNIGDQAFSGCKSLVSVTIPKSVKSIEGAFSGCENLTAVHISDIKSWLDIEGSFYGSWNLYINGALVTDLIIPEGVTNIRSSAFYGCESLTSVTIPESVSTIDDRAFENCKSLSSITIPEGVTSIGYNTFYGCSNLASIVIPESITAIGSDAFKGTMWYENQPDGAIYVGNVLYKYKGTMPKNSTIEIRQGTVVICPYAFYGCGNPTSINLPNGLKKIGDAAFYECWSLTSVTIPEGVTSIGEIAFAGCWGLTSITLPQSITEIGAFAFEGCYSLESITCKATNPPSCSEAFDAFMLGEVDRTIPVYVPDASVSAYKEAEEWKEFINIMPLSSKNDKYVLTYLVDGAVYRTDSLDYDAPIVLPEEPTKEGYTFSGWGEVPETMPENDVTVSGTFIKNKYLVTFKIGDEVIAVDSLEYGATVVAPEAPEKEGYTFDGWGEVVETVPANDVTIEGSYSVNSYLLTYTVDGETVQMDSVAYGTAITLLDEPLKEGHTFSGWSEAPETMPAENVTISGTFTVNKYLVTFKIGDEVIAADSLEYGTTVVAPEAPEKEGYTFNGWGDVVETVPANDLTYEGSYSVNSYLLTYTIDGETVQADSVAYGTAITLLEAPEKEGHTFSGWSEAPETMPANDVVISGTFAINKYLVTFKIDDEVIAADSLEYGATVVAPEAPEKEGYTFNGWGDVVETVPANDLTYEGSYSVNSYLLTYTIDGETVQADSVAYGTAITLLEAPEKEGHTFSGWSEAPETMPANDVIISGTFTVNKYLVAFKIDDEVIAADSLEYGTTIVAPEAPEKDGHTFEGWGEVAETVPASDVTYEGTYTVNIYKVYYYVGEELVHTAEVAYGEAIPEYVYEPTEEGYAFLGWVGDTYETMPAHDVVYTANIDDAIHQLTNDKGQLTIYDLTGRKVTDTENLKGGIYIINGQKMIIKE